MSDNNDKGFSVIDRRASQAKETEAVGETSTGDKPTYVANLERALAEKELQVRELSFAHENAVGDMDSAKHRIQSSSAKEAELSRRSLIVDFLEVLDNLDRALEAAEQGGDMETLTTGVQMVNDLFLTKLRSLGVSRMLAMGEPFDPSKHEALTMVPATDPSVDGTIVGVIKEGYSIGEDILRPAAVAVAKNRDH